MVKESSTVSAVKPSVPFIADYLYSVADMLMGSLLNGMLRSPAQWTKLFAEADSRYKFIGVRPVGGDKGLAEAIFDE